VNINVYKGIYADTFQGDDNVIPDKAKVVMTTISTDSNTGYPVPSHAKGAIGAINNVFGGGNAAAVIGNTTVNIGTETESFREVTITAGTSVTDYYIHTGTGYENATGNAVDGTKYYEKIDVIGADIRGNVYGGGNQADVSGNTNVTIGKGPSASSGSGSGSGEGGSDGGEGSGEGSGGSEGSGEGGGGTTP